ncbi:DUF952 domain-containing protein [Rhodobacteraceae bacterium CCMM004]|nr:DUF952 domain-containing protein [Rhodobacteraceae bacterium CCMM004]
MHIYKIFRPDEAAELERAGETAGAPVDRADGYVHFSTAEQVGETLTRHFAGEDGLVLLAVPTDRLGNDLRWEPSRGGAMFPHLYRTLRQSDVLWSRPIGRVGEAFFLPDLAP